ncbi:hypothetical protein OQA88_13698 [Cercophora sp. LCS_1]
MEHLSYSLAPANPSSTRYAVDLSTATSKKMRSIPHSKGFVRGKKLHVFSPFPKHNFIKDPVFEGEFAFSVGNYAYSFTTEVLRSHLEYRINMLSRQSLYPERLPEGRLCQFREEPISWTEKVVRARPRYYGTCGRPEEAQIYQEHFPSGTPPKGHSMIFGVPWHTCALRIHDVFQRISYESWLTNQEVSALMGYVLRDKEDMVYIASLGISDRWFNPITHKKTRLEMASRRFWAIPVNIGGSHWIAAVFNNLLGVLYSADSMNNDKATGYKRLKEIVIPWLVRSSILVIIPEDIELEWVQMPHQRGGSECGLMVVEAVRIILLEQTIEGYERPPRFDGYTSPTHATNGKVWGKRCNKDKLSHHITVCWGRVIHDALQYEPTCKIPYFGGDTAWDPEDEGFVLRFYNSLINLPTTMDSSLVVNSPPRVANNATTSLSIPILPKRSPEQPLESPTTSIVLQSDVQYCHSKYAGIGGGGGSPLQQNNEDDEDDNEIIPEDAPTTPADNDVSMVSHYNVSMQDISVGDVSMQDNKSSGPTPLEDTPSSPPAPIMFNGISPNSSPSDRTTPALEVPGDTTPELPLLLPATPASQPQETPKEASSELSPPPATAPAPNITIHTPFKPLALAPTTPATSTANPVAPRPPPAAQTLPANETPNIAPLNPPLHSPTMLATVTLKDATPCLLSLTPKLPVPAPTGDAFSAQRGALKVSSAIVTTSVLIGSTGSVAPGAAPPLRRGRSAAPSSVSVVASKEDPSLARDADRLLRPLFPRTSNPFLPPTHEADFHGWDDL